MESDVRYYSRRADEERRRALHALTPEARERHKELASLFAAKAETPSRRAALKEPQLVRG
jgi:hypothetical protein